MMSPSKLKADFVLKLRLYFMNFWPEDWKLEFSCGHCISGVKGCFLLNFHNLSFTLMYNVSYSVVSEVSLRFHGLKPTRPLSMEFSARILEWVAVLFLQGSSRSKDQPLSPTLLADSFHLGHQTAPHWYISRLFYVDYVGISFGFDLK